MTRKLIALAALSIALPGTASAQSDTPSPERMKADVAALVAFGTRHTLSVTDDPKRGIGAARTWAADQLNQISDACGGCITVANIGRTFTGPRAPNGVEIVDVLGFQQGDDPKRVVIVGGHIDSRVGDIMDAKADAPGANDDGSGVAVVLAAARALSKQHFRATIVYAIFSGEEQGLYGGTLLADTAKEKGWTVSAMLNNDIVGNSLGSDGTRVAGLVRVFSEGIAAADDDKAVALTRAIGGEDDSPSRELAKTADNVAAKIPAGLDVFVDRRPDRFGRGGDHEPFLKLGYPAIRFTAGTENWAGQHQYVRVENGVDYGDTIDKMDFAYLAKVAAINIALIRRLAAAPAAPEDVTIAGALSHDTKVAWDAVPGATQYRIRWRRTDQQDWTGFRDVTGTDAVLKNVPIDDNFVGVSSLAADGAESLVTFAGPAPH